MSELTIQSLERGTDSLHQEDFSLMISHARALKYMHDKAIGLRNPTWTTSYLREHATTARAAK